MTIVLMNLGTGPIGDEAASEEHAIANIAQFRSDILAQVDATYGPRWQEKREGKNLAWERNASDDREGRYGFILRHAKRRTDILMPGLPIEAVRWRRDHLSCLTFPRLYVDGSSWLWMYAVHTAQGDLALAGREGRYPWLLPCTPCAIHDDCRADAKLGLTCAIEADAKAWKAYVATREKEAARWAAAKTDP